MVKRAKSQRKKLYALHSWLGFHLALLMSLVLVTGTFATVSNEIDWLLQADMRVTPGESTVSLNEMESAIKRHAPNHTLISLGSMGHDWMAYRARMISQERNAYFLHIDQWTGEVTGSSPTLTVQRFFRDIHRYLFMPSYIGLPIVGSLAFVLAISLYTGLKTTRKWGKMALRVRFYRGPRVAIGDLHKAAGLWSSWFIALMAVTGIWYLAELGSYVVGSPFEPARPVVKNEVKEQMFTAPRRPIEHYVNAATQAFPELQVSEIFFPVRSGSSVIVRGTRSNMLLRDRANSVFLNPANAEIIKVQREEEIGWPAYLNEMADPLHFGTFGGLTTKIVWFLFGVLMTGLSLSGVLLYWKRMGSTKLSRQQLATLPVLIGMLIAGSFWLQRQLGPITVQKTKPDTVELRSTTQGIIE